MKAVPLYAVLFACGITLHAQPKPHALLRLSHPLNPGRSATSGALQYRDTVRVLVVRVDFQTSTDSRVTGDGKFMLQPATGAAVDPPPHDQLYLSYKLQFLQNYFRKVSGGKLTIVSTILNRVLTMPNQMSAYAPSTNGNNVELANLAVDAWMKADSAFPGFPFADYDAFVVFHAGVGHDLNLVNILGYDPAPANLPTLYLGLQALKNAFQNQAYDGIPVDSGRFKISNSIILPETDTQYFVGSQSTEDTIQVSINGIFAACIGSHLGLPDLWDTNTGASGIGQYGLEDGASFFAYYGLFPPEPCAWEKIRLGWVTPMTVSASTTNLVVPAVSLYHAGPTFTGQDTIYKVPITNSEYFLVENRSRDPFAKGVTLTIVQNGLLVNKSFDIDSTGFNNNDISAISGSVVDVSNYDWALLRFLDLTSPDEGGGILIWHIDENVVNAGLATNTVNANPARRGIDLEEAKGPQDIGQAYSSLDPGAGSENGNPYDPWFLGSISPTYTNRFDRSSFPNSNANSGAYSLVTMKDFSARLPRMTFSVQFGDDYLKPASGFPKSLGVSTGDKTVQTWSNGIYVSKGDSVYVFRYDGSSGVPNATGLMTSNGGTYPLVYDPTPSDTFFVGAKDSSLILVSVSDTTGDGVFDVLSVATLNIGHRITTQPVLKGKDIAVGHADGGMLQVDPISRRISTVVAGLVNPVVGVISGNCAVTVTGIKDSLNRTYIFPTPFQGFAVAHGSTIFLVDTAQRSLTILKNDLTFLGSASLGNWPGSVTKPSASDIYHNGDDAVLMTVGNEVLGFNSHGFPLDGFPFKVDTASGNAAPILLARLTNNNAEDVVTVSSAGILAAYSNRGRLLPDFPFQVGTNVSGRPASFPIAASGGTTQTGVSVMGDDGMLYTYNISVQYVAVDTTPLRALSSDFFPGDRVYNWPNPVYGSSTRIRFYCSQDANIAVTVFDIAGKKITELNGKAVGGVDTELAWDVSGIQSGVYLARVVASNVNQSQARIIKIAVVR